jgi:hypothetical protein
MDERIIALERRVSDLERDKIQLNPNPLMLTTLKEIITKLGFT